MRSKWGLVAILLVGLASAPLAASARHQSFDTAEQCIQSGSVMTGLPTCTSSGGKWVASHPSDPATQARNLFATFAVIWVILVIGSVVWVVSTANKHGDPVGTALVGALVGGPLFVLLYGTNSDLIKRTRKVYRLTDRLPDDPSSPPPSTPRTDKAERLRELARLRDEGLITDDEFGTRRTAIIDEV